METVVRWAGSATLIEWCVVASSELNVCTYASGRMQGRMESGKRMGRSSNHQRLAADHTTAAIAAIGVCLLRRGRCRQGRAPPATPLLALDTCVPTSPNAFDIPSSNPSKPGSVSWQSEQWVDWPAFTFDASLGGVRLLVDVPAVTTIATFACSQQHTYHGTHPVRKTVIQPAHTCHQRPGTST